MRLHAFSPIDRDILRIAVPSVISNITVPLLGLADVAITGHLGSPDYIGAIAVGSMIFNVIYWVFGFLRMGTSGMTSQAFGRDNPKEMADMLSRSLSVGLVIGILLLIAQPFILQAGMALMSPPQSIRSLVSAYFRICIWGAPAVLGLYGLTGWFIGMQDTRIPMIVSISQNIINILASLSLVFLAGMRIEGVALGTLVAQYAGLLMAILLLLWRYRRLAQLSSLSALRLREPMLRFFRVNRDIFLRTLFIVAVNMFFTVAGSRQGSMILAVNTLLFQLFTLYSFVMDSFAYAGEALCGKHYGSGSKQEFIKAMRHLFLWGLALTIAYTLVYWLGGEPFLSLLTDDISVCREAREYIPWAICIPLAGMAAFIWDGIYIGITATKGMLLSSLIAALCFFSVWLGLSPLMANHALWLALIVYLAARGIVQTLLFRKYKRSVSL